MRFGARGIFSLEIYVEEEQVYSESKNRSCS